MVRKAEDEERPIRLSRSIDRLPCDLCIQTVSRPRENQAQGRHVG